MYMFIRQNQDEMGRKFKIELHQMKNFESEMRLINYSFVHQIEMHKKCKIMIK